MKCQERLIFYILQITSLVFCIVVVARIKHPSPHPEWVRASSIPFFIPHAKSYGAVISYPETIFFGDDRELLRPNAQQTPRAPEDSCFLHPLEGSEKYLPATYGKRNVSLFEDAGTFFTVSENVCAQLHQSSTYKDLVPMVGINPFLCEESTWAKFVCSPEKHHMIVQECISITDVQNYPCSDEIVKRCCEQTRVSFQGRQAHVVNQLDKTSIIFDDTGTTWNQAVFPLTITHQTLFQCDFTMNSQSYTWTCI